MILHIHVVRHKDEPPLPMPIANEETVRELLAQVITSGIIDARVLTDGTMSRCLLDVAAALEHGRCTPREQFVAMANDSFDVAVTSDLPETGPRV